MMLQCIQSVVVCVCAVFSLFLFHNCFILRYFSTFFLSSCVFAFAWALFADTIDKCLCTFVSVRVCVMHTHIFYHQSVAEYDRKFSDLYKLYDMIAELAIDVTNHPLPRYTNENARLFIYSFIYMSKKYAYAHVARKYPVPYSECIEVRANEQLR